MQTSIASSTAQRQAAYLLWIPEHTAVMYSVAFGPLLWPFLHPSQIHYHYMEAGSARDLTSSLIKGKEIVHILERFEIPAQSFDAVILFGTPLENPSSSEDQSAVRMNMFRTLYESLNPGGRMLVGLESCWEIFRAASVPLLRWHRWRERRRVETAIRQFLRLVPSVESQVFEVLPSLWKPIVIESIGVDTLIREMALSHLGSGWRSRFFREITLRSASRMRAVITANLWVIEKDIYESPSLLR